MNKEVAHKKTVKITNKARKQNLGKYLDIVKNKWLNKTNKCNHISINWSGYTVITRC
jgi:hypothetical protein